VISGGSRGLGRVLVADFLGRGHVVATFSRTRTPYIADLEREVPEAGAFLWEQVDVTDHEGVRQFILTIARRYGRIDVLVNNAAVGVDGLLAFMRPEQIHLAVALNLVGAIHLIQVCSRVMLAQRSGSIINISSNSALRGHSGTSVYSATKAALDGLTRSLARELGQQMIRVNSVAPGLFDSDMTGAITEDQRQQIVRRTPLGRLATPEDVAGVVRFLAGPESQFVTGQTLVVDGGFTC
jgi:3-oxoacyl-[acyl-carrier protein] reductase